MNPSFLLINPPVYDFAAYDLWAKPLGLLTIASILKNNGAHVDVLDYMDRYFPGMPVSETKASGCGSYQKSAADKPEVLRGIPKNYGRYGVFKGAAHEYLRSRSVPNAILVSSGMTYWYPGVQEAVSAVRAVFPGVPVILGGVYATLCTAHAKIHSGADHVVPGSDLSELFLLLRSLGILDIEPLTANFRDHPFPYYQCYSGLNYAVIRTSMGCPFRCSYCAINDIYQGPFVRKQPEGVAAEIKYISQTRMIRNVAFYDDALLFDPLSHFIPLAEIVSRECPECFFHSPNGLHARFIDLKVAQMMKKMRFVFPRLSLETANRERQISTGDKLSNEGFVEAVENLRRSGYSPGEYICYLLMGIPEQTLEEVEEAILFAHKAGAVISISEYSPIPGTADWNKAVNKLPSLDPLWHNNSLFPLYRKEDWAKINAVKNLARGLNRKLKS